MAECYDEVMTGEFSQFDEEKILMVHDQLQVEETNQEVEVMVECKNSEASHDGNIENSIYLANSLGSSVGLARVQVNLLVYPVLHGWMRSLRIINYLLAVPRKVKHKSHLIPDDGCQICENTKTKGEFRTDELNAEKYLFRYETQVIKKCMKDEQIQEFEEIDNILFYKGKIAPENQLRTQDLVGCKFFDFKEIGQPVPVVLEDSPVLYSYIMWIHNKINPHAGVETTIREVSKKMRVPYGLRKLVKRITLD